MSIEEIENLLSRITKTPLKNEVKVDFDRETKTFRFSTAIYQNGAAIPLSVQSYVNARRGRSFLPHQTSFQWLESNEVALVQEVPFQWGFQPTLRHKITEFSRLAKGCHQMLMEIAVEG